MANQEETTMPSSQGGLVQYFEADTGWNLDPKVVIGFGVMIAALEILLHMGL